MQDAIGPVQVLAVGFRAGAQFEGRIADEIDRLERAQTIRVLDFVFLHRDEATGSVVRVDYQGGESDGPVATLLDDDAAAAGSPGAAGAFRLGADDIREAADALDPGMSAGFLIFEHVWARGLKQAIADTDGVPFAEGFLTPDVVAAIAEPRS